LTYDAEPSHVEEIGIGFSGTAQIIACDGCKTISFRDENYFSEGDPGPTISLYPVREEDSVCSKLYLGDGICQVPRIIRTIYTETLAAINSKLSTLAGIGIRGIIEAVCKEKNVKGKLYDQINSLVNMSLLTSDGAKILHRIRTLGNEAAHEMKAPTKDQIIAAMKVLDHLLLGVYVLPDEAAILPTTKPKVMVKKVLKKKTNP
jgi:hypothetical protein